MSVPGNVALLQVLCALAGQETIGVNWLVGDESGEVQHGLNFVRAVSQLPDRYPRSPHLP